MSNLNEEIELLPDPARIVNGLRDTGYNFNTAIADIVDNSIAAKATKISINVSMDPCQNVRVYIADNGIGMDMDGLKNAMKYGSKERVEKNSLGKFGLGLKTASTAFCKQLSLISRGPNDADVRKVQWDLDYISDIGSWKLKIVPVEDEEVEILDMVASEATGTLVVWNKVDRLLKSYQKQSAAKKALEKKIDDLRFHLSMVFQRFLDESDSRAANTSIELNGFAVEPWDPFCTKEPKSELVQCQDVPVDIENGEKTSFKVAAYVIPRKSEFSSKEASEKARGNNDYQGFYVYRENRLIHYGDWLGFFTKEPHGSLLRVDFSFTHELDELLNVDIKKSRIMLISELADFLIKFLAAPRREAQKRYRDGETKSIHQPGKEAHNSSNSSINAKAPEVENSRMTPTGKPDEVVVDNPYGSFKKKITIGEAEIPTQNRVVPVPSIDGNALWEPALINGLHAVRINENHDFYKKVYGPILSKGVIVEGLDDLLWALAEAENSTCNQTSIENYEDMRFTVSRILKKLVADLPDPEMSEE